MRTDILLIALSLLVVMAGCSVYSPGIQPTIISNVPYHTTTLTVLNSTHFNLDVIRDGETIVKLRPGEHYSFGLWNLSARSAETSIAVVATDSERRMVGSASRSFYVDGYSRRSETWIIDRYVIRE